MIQAVLPDDVVLGGGNAKKLKRLPKGCRAGQQRLRVHWRLPPVEGRAEPPPSRTSTVASCGVT